MPGGLRWGELGSEDEDEEQLMGGHMGVKVIYYSHRPVCLTSCAYASSLTVSRRLHTDFPVYSSRLHQYIAPDSAHQTNPTLVPSAEPCHTNKTDTVTDLCPSARVSNTRGLIHNTMIVDER